jgi:hypothetical protein
MIPWINIIETIIYKEKEIFLICIKMLKIKVKMKYKIKILTINYSYNSIKTLILRQFKSINLIQIQWKGL